MRALVRRALGGQPAAPVAERSKAGQLDAPTVRGVIELGLRVGEAMLSLGAAAADVTGSIQRIATAFGLEGCQVDLTFTSITVSYDPGAGGTPLTVMRVARSRTVDYGRLSAVLRLERALTDRQVPPAEAPGVLDRAHDELDAVLGAAQPYRPAVITLLLSAMAAAVALLLGGGVWVALIAGATTALIDRVVRWLGRRGVPAFFLQAVGAAIATGVAVLLLVIVPVLPVELATLPPSLVVASGIVVLLAGLSLVGAADDALSGFPVTASGRVFEVFLLTLGIVVGIGAVLDVSRRMGVALDLVDDPTALVSPVIQVASAAVVAGAWALASYARPRAAAVAGLAGAVAWLVFAGLRELQVGPAVASAGAALLVGFGAESLASRFKVPALVTSACGIVPLLPGLAIYHGLYLLADDSSSLAEGAQVLLGAAMVGLGLAAGVTLGELIAAPVRRSMIAQRREAWRRPRRRPRR